MVPYEVTHNVDLAGQLAAGRRRGTCVAVYGPAPHPLWLTIFTSMFMHGGLLHIGGNMLYLWIFGNNIEDALGKFRFLVFYLVCGFAAALAQIAAAPTRPSRPWARRGPSRACWRPTGCCTRTRAS